MRLFKSLLVLVLVLIGMAAHAENTGGKSSKSIDFDGEVVEGVNKQPLDSLNQLSEQDNSRYKMHLYQKRMSFKHESKQVLREMAETY